MSEIEIETTDADVEIEQPTESKMHRFRIGDVVSWDDTSEHPPTHYEGPILRFGNSEGTYLVCDFGGEEKELTEDEVRRIA